MERRIYEIARKHCGKSPKWHIGLEKLQGKTGSNAPLKRFRLNLRQIIEEDNTPFYSISIDDKDLVTFRPRKEAKPLGVYDLVVHMKTHEKAHKYAGGWDTFVLEGKWREWLLDSGFIPDSVEGSFMAFVKNTLRTTAKHRNRNTGRLTLSQHYIPCVVMRIV
ncbi:MAG: replication initiator protein A [Tateyamaria sp.]|nr:replication initiator protein A [Tateyamaria sp.]